VVNGPGQEEGDEPFPSHNPRRVGREEIVEKLLTTEYVREELEKAGKTV